ncbi:MAG: hypothetical protein V4610_07470 [Pseudomonadota bacterium]
MPPLPSFPFERLNTRIPHTHDKKYHCAKPLAPFVQISERELEITMRNRRSWMEIVFEGMLALSYICAGTACAGIVITRLSEGDPEWHASPQVSNIEATPPPPEAAQEQPGLR